MTRTGPEPLGDGAANPLARPAVVAQLEKILTSATFIRSKRLGRFLRFTVEQCLDGRQNTVKEYLVGVEVFNKLETFDPRIDSIVRVEARRLRSKLDRYYQTEGREDALVIQLRKGSYVPQLLTREQFRALGFSEEPAVRAPAKSVGVSKFTNLGLDNTYAHFCSGLTEDVIGALTKISSLRVVARIPGYPDEVRPDYIVEGSVRYQGGRLRISVQVIEAATSLYVWSDTYERNLDDAFAVQDEISRSIVAVLRKEFQTVRI